MGQTIHRPGTLQPTAQQTAAGLAGLAALWLLLTHGEAGAWVVGVPTLIAATWALRKLRTGAATGLSVSGLLRFVPFFIAESLRGGADVAIRTIAPGLRIAPGFTDYRVRLHQPQARVFFANCVSLLPGTLAADLRGERLTVHMLDARLDPGAELQRLEHRVALIYRQAH